MGKRWSIAFLILGITSCSSGITTGSTPTTRATSPTTTTTSIPNTTTTVDSDAPSTTVFEDPGMLLVVGDWGSGTAPQGAVAGAMARISEDNPVAAVLTTGDNFYIDDAEFLLEPYDWVIESDIPFWITWGDHDIETSQREELVNEALGDPPRWTTHRWGNISIVVLDSNQVPDPTQLLFLESELARIEGPTIVVFHHPAYSCSRHGSSVEIQDLWVDRFDPDVLLALSGHDHGYQRIQQQQRTFVVTGGGGSALDEIEECGLEMENSAELHHFVVLQQTEDVIWGTAVDVNGSPFDEFFINLDEGVLDTDD
jgi:hypothetical protein